MTPYRLHYAPDNASLVIRLALEELRAPYMTVLVDRSAQGQRTPAYLQLNPNGLIPVLETRDGPMFETAAILLWLADRHGGLAPAPTEPERGALLKWLFFLSNTLHPALRMLFYPARYVGPEPVAHEQLRDTQRGRIAEYLAALDNHWAKAAPPLLLALYLAPMLRWLALYPRGSDTTWFDLGAYPALRVMAESLESRASVAAAQRAEGLGPTPFTAPRQPQPPEGNAT
ncbi:glutathione S-transferase family protein [Sulfitobacter sp. D35]|uniref:glutathione S-transferase family protein n=1 Tax=Sulfitobacter sp. D35 TaxID=3083252 RepID=UPI00296F458D|nr:glutathione S-transferase family protein [Sulfitobacter sp. D35]MDW4499609.1 glutathione S-transferase family protein [Sulfitobacter sp. D35]